MARLSSPHAVAVVIAQQRRRHPREVFYGDRKLCLKFARKLKVSMPRATLA
jgi:hypothetical protein